MRLLERARIRREAQAAYEAAIADGKSHDEAQDVCCDAMREKYGATVDWATIIKIITLLLELLRPKTA